MRQCLCRLVATAVRGASSPRSQLDPTLMLRIERSAAAVKAQVGTAEFHHLHNLQV
ncbi:MAG: hypothetical protein VKL59_10640 [Nostocaceae cyanobacterium]|nr:hypothetical protein [Nostocaceae cyanobacterium]